MNYKTDKFCKYKRGVAKRDIWSLHIHTAQVKKKMDQLISLSVSSIINDKTEKSQNFLKKKAHTLQIFTNLMGLHILLNNMKTLCLFAKVLQNNWTMSGEKIERQFIIQRVKKYLIEYCMYF